MRGRKKDFVTDVSKMLSSNFRKFTQGKRKFVPMALLLAILILFGVGASVIMIMGLFGIYAIILVFRMNSEWIRKEEERSSDRSKRK